MSTRRILRPSSRSTLHVPQYFLEWRHREVPAAFYLYWNADRLVLSAAWTYQHRSLARRFVSLPDYAIRLLQCRELLLVKSRLVLLALVSQAAFVLFLVSTVCGFLQNPIRQLIIKIRKTLRVRLDYYCEILRTIAVEISDNASRVRCNDFIEDTGYRIADVFLVGRFCWPSFFSDCRKQLNRRRTISPG